MKFSLLVMLTLAATAAIAQTPPTPANPSAPGTTTMGAPAQPEEPVVIPTPPPAMTPVDTSSIAGFLRRSKAATCRMLNRVPPETNPVQASQRKVHADAVRAARLSAGGVTNFSNSFDRRLIELCNQPHDGDRADFQRLLTEGWQASCNEAFRGQRVFLTQRAIYGSDLYKCRRAGPLYGQLIGTYQQAFQDGAMDEGASVSQARDCTAGVSDATVPEQSGEDPSDAELDGDGEVKPE